MQVMVAQKCAECRPDAFQMQVPTTNYCRASSFAPPSPAKKLLTTLSLNSVWYFFMKPLEVCPTSGGQFTFEEALFSERIEL